MNYEAIYMKAFEPYYNNGYIKKLQERMDAMYGDDSIINPSDPDDATDNEEDNTDVDNSTSDDDTITKDEQIAELEDQFQAIKDEQGWVGNLWDGIKNLFGHPNGSNKVSETIAKVESGEATYEEAVVALNNYQQKQDGVVDTFANIASGLVAGASTLFAIPTFGASLAVGFGLGAATKVAIKGSDAATNNVEGDYSFKDGAKDVLTGGVGGLVTVATAGIGKAATTTGKVLVREGALSGARAGCIDGAAMSATDYIADAVFDGKEFTVDGLIGETIKGGVTGAAVGGAFGAATTGLRNIKGRTKSNVIKEATEQSTINNPIGDTIGKNSEQGLLPSGIKNTEETIGKATEESIEKTKEESFQKAAKEAFYNGKYSNTYFDKNVDESIMKTFSEQKNALPKISASTSNTTNSLDSLFNNLDNINESDITNITKNLKTTQDVTKFLYGSEKDSLETVMNDISSYENRISSAPEALQDSLNGLVGQLKKVAADLIS